MTNPLRLEIATRFHRDVRRLRRRGRDMGKLQAIVDRLAAKEPLEPHNRLHRLSGNLAGQWECHIEPDWLLIWRQDDDSIFLIRTGIHSDLFG